MIPIKTEKLTRLALLAAVALILFVVELAIPLPLPIAGLKLGLANIVTLIAVYRFSVGEAAAILAARVILGSLIAGNPTALFYSFAGAAFCMVAMLLLKRAIPERAIWLNSIVGAAFHHLGQLCAAALLLGSPSVFAYYPILLLLGGVTGSFTGVCAMLLLKRFPPRKKAGESGTPSQKEKDENERF
ncbi:MAG: Gx transporter family protein [Eubacterium sp.]|nr:Gx transporter family protein [Eubacterium sp.]MCM1417380.1 Gx transporter family protein [Roseburia sp.]